MSEYVFVIMFGVLLRNEYTEIFNLYILYNKKVKIIINIIISYID